MAGPQKESSILFSNNVITSFSDLNPSTVLVPPVIATADDKQESGNSLNQSSFSTLAPEKTSGQRYTGSPKPLPPFSRPSDDSAGSSFLRKPISKYVVPPDISAFTKSSSPRPPFLPHSNAFIGNHPTTFIPDPPSQAESAEIIFNSNHFGSSENSEINLSSDQSHTSFIPYENSSTVVPASFTAMATDPPISGEMYHPVIHHWFYVEGKESMWKPFSFNDSINLEQVFRQGKTEVVSTDGGHFDVDVTNRIRTPIYWEAAATPVMRCSWFRRTANQNSPVPFSEESSEKLETVYKEAMITGQWHRQVELRNWERVMINSPHSIHHYQSRETSDSPTIASISESQTPLTVRRGADDFEIKDGVSDQIDHLLFLIHGIGSFCDLSFRSVHECVNDFRGLGEEMLSTHFKDAIDRGDVGRVDILPISWHKALHGDATGLDAKLKNITLRSIPKLRDFTNDTLLDILFYTSPVYCQHIMDTVTSEMDRLLTIFKKRHPNFGGSVSLGGHSLGSVILFDLLMHQNPNLPIESSTPSVSKKDIQTDNEDDGLETSSSTSQINFQIGIAGTGQPAIVYPQLPFKPKAFFMMGSPVGMFITVRGIDKLGPDFRLPTCDHVYNIFHPFDPVAYRIESLIDSSFEQLRPVLIPHHKGRKRMHLELKDTIERVGYDLKHKIFDSISATWNKFYQIYSGSPDDGVHHQVDQAIQEQMSRMNIEEDSVVTEPKVKIGELNRGERIDYVLQEKPYESFTEYIFALQAHLTYWTSEDTMLMMLKELYKIDGIFSDEIKEDIPRMVQSPQESIRSFVPPLENIIPSPPVPLIPIAKVSTNDAGMFPSSTSVMLPSSGAGVAQPLTKPRNLRGRPVFDPTKAPVMQLGMDPTATPADSSIAPPPIVTQNMRFNKRT